MNSKDPEYEELIAKIEEIMGELTFSQVHWFCRDVIKYIQSVEHIVGYGKMSQLMYKPKSKIGDGVEKLIDWE